MTTVEDELDAYTYDLSMLFKNFDAKQSLRFEDFCAVWREMNFSFIHSGQKTVNEKIKFTERLLRCTTGFFNPETPFQYRIAAIYAAYAIYYTQLARPKVKIRMTIAMWKDLKDLQTLIKRHQHLDVDYIITKLENDKAFLYTAMPKLLEYGRKELMTNMPSAGSTVNTERRFYKPDEYVEDLIQGFDVAEKISYIDDEYREVKNEILRNIQQDADPTIISSLNAVRDDFRSGLVDDVEEFRELLESNPQSQVSVDGSQRPVSKSLRTDEEQASTSSTNTTQKALTLTRSQRVKALKLESFRRNTKGEQAENSLTQEVKSQKKTKRTEVKTYYRRSAIVEKLETRPWKAKWQSRIKKSKEPKQAQM